MPLSCRAEFAASHLSSVSSHLSVSARLCADRPRPGRASFNYGCCCRQGGYVVRLCQDHWDKYIGKTANDAAACVYHLFCRRKLVCFPCATSGCSANTYVPSYVQNLRHLFRQIIGINSSLLPLYICHYGSASPVKSS